MDVPSSFKKIIPFIRRAEELDRDTSGREEVQVMAYFCRLHAAESVLKIPNRNKDENGFLMQLLDHLERDKEKLSTDSVRDGKDICTAFALEVFNKADEEDALGLSDKETAKTFNAAGNFFDALLQFGELDADCAEKKKFSKYKALEILKAIKEGRLPAQRSQLEFPVNDEEEDESGATIGSSVSHNDDNREPLKAMMYEPFSGDTDTETIPLSDRSMNRTDARQLNKDVEYIPHNPLSFNPSSPSRMTVTEAKNIPKKVDVENPFNLLREELHNELAADSPIENIQKAIKALEKKDTNCAKIFIQAALSQL